MQQNTSFLSSLSTNQSRHKVPTLWKLGDKKQGYKTEALLLENKECLYTYNK
jgi:hypothetical protein